MLPIAESDLLSDFTEQIKPSFTYKIVGNRVIGFTDGADAIKQAVELILNTERYENGMYSWNYGVETREVFGLNPQLIHTLLEERIKEALLQDDRIIGVSNFDFLDDKGKLTVKFTIKSVFDNVEISTNIEKEIREHETH